MGSGWCEEDPSPEDVAIAAARAPTVDVEWMECVAEESDARVTEDRFMASRWRSPPPSEALEGLSDIAAAFSLTL